MKSATPASEAMAAAVTGLSPVIITVLMPMRRSSAKRSLISGFTTSLRWMTPSRRPPSARPSGVPPERAMRSTAARSSGGCSTVCPISSVANLLTAVDGALAQPAAADIDAREPRGRRERDEPRIGRRRLGHRHPIPLLHQRNDRPALGGLVRQAREQRGLRRLALGDAGRRDDLGRLPVAEGDGAGLVEQQRVDVAGGLDRAARHGEHVELEQPVHAGDADGRQQAADGGRDQRHEQGDEDRH